MGLNKWDGDDYPCHMPGWKTTFICDSSSSDDETGNEDDDEDDTDDDETDDDDDDDEADDGGDDDDDETDVDETDVDETDVDDDGNDDSDKDEDDDDDVEVVEVDGGDKETDVGLEGFDMSCKLSLISLIMSMKEGLSFGLWAQHFLINAENLFGIPNSSFSSIISSLSPSFTPSRINT